MNATCYSIAVISIRKNQSNLLFFLIIIISFVLCVLRIDSFQVGSYVDDAHYLILAESLATGRGYSLINFPSSPIELSFPPGWPLILAWIMIVSNNTMIIMKFALVIMWILSISLTWSLLSKRIISPMREMTVSLMALNPAAIGSATIFMSEIPFLLFSLITLKVADIAFSNKSSKGEGVFLIVGLLAVFTQSIRAVGLALILALFVYLFFSKRLIPSIITGAAILLGLLPQVLWYSRIGGHLTTPGYHSQVLSGSLYGKLQQIINNSISYMNNTTSGIILPILGSRAFTSSDINPFILALPLINVVIVALCFTGWFVFIRKFDLAAIYSGFYCAGILSFHNPEVGSVQARFLIPLLPFLYLFLLKGSQFVIVTVAKLDPEKFVSVAMSVVLLFLILGAIQSIMDWKNPIRSRITDLSIGTEWVKLNTPADSIIMSVDPVPAYLYTRRHTVPFPDNIDLDNHIKKNYIDYVIISPKLNSQRNIDLEDNTQIYILPILSTRIDDYQLVYSSPEHNVAVYKVCKQSC
jgi:hypothetical protein